MKSTTINVYDWFDIQDEICKCMGIKENQFRDLKESHGHFNKWCDSKGYGKKDPEGKDRNSSQIWYGEYQEAADGVVARPPYYDLWHVALKSVVPNNMCNDSIVTMVAIEDYDDTPEAYDDNEEWKRSFFKAYNQVMLSIDPEYEGVNVKFSW